MTGIGEAGDSASNQAGRQGAAETFEQFRTSGQQWLQQLPRPIEQLAQPKRLMNRDIWKGYADYLFSYVIPQGRRNAGEPLKIGTAHGYLGHMMLNAYKLCVAAPGGATDQAVILFFMCRQPGAKVDSAIWFSALKLQMQRKWMERSRLEGEETDFSAPAISREAVHQMVQLFATAGGAEVRAAPARW